MQMHILFSPSAEWLIRIWVSRMCCCWEIFTCFTFFQLFPASPFSTFDKTVTDERVEDEKCEVIWTWHQRRIVFTSLSFQFTANRNTTLDSLRGRTQTESKWMKRFIVFRVVLRTKSVLVANKSTKVKNFNGKKSSTSTRDSLKSLKNNCEKQRFINVPEWHIEPNWAANINRTRLAGDES